MRYQFNDCLLDTDRRELRREGQVVPVEPKAFDLLVCLLENRDHVLSKDRLIETVWQGRIVSDSALTTCLNSVRASVRDTGREQRVIRTVARRGLRFIAQVLPEVAAPAPIEIGSAVLSGRGVTGPSLGVLSFSNLSDDPAQTHVADGIADDIITELSRYQELFVVARHSSFRFKGHAVDVRQVGNDLGVQYLVEGGVRRSGSRLRVNVGLVETARGRKVWSDVFESVVADLFDVLDEIVRAIVGSLSLQINRVEAERISRTTPTEWAAYELVMRGNGHLRTFQASYGAADLHAARDRYDAALEIDPRYAPALVGRAFTHALAWMHRLDADYLSPAALDRAHEDARLAVRCDPRLPQARAEVGYSALWKRDYRTALEGFAQAVVLNPNFCDWRHAAVLTYDGQCETAERVVRDYMRRDPYFPAMAIGWLGIARHMQGRYAEALAPLIEFRDRVPTHRGARAQLAAVYARLRMQDEAEREVAELLALNPDERIGCHVRQHSPFRLAAHNELLWEGLRIAGLRD